MNFSLRVPDVKGQVYRDFCAHHHIRFNDLCILGLDTVMARYEHKLPYLPDGQGDFYAPSDFEMPLIF